MLETFRKAIHSPKSIGLKLNRMFWRDNFDTSTKYNTAGIDVFEEDWDNLILLDACRYDVFEEVSDLSGTLESRISRGSHSREFIRGNFTGKQLGDTVYASANGNFGILKEEIGASILKFVFVERDRIDGRTSHPATAREKAEELFKEFPNKRLIVHFMQPHQPYLGPTGRDMPYEGGLMPTVKSPSVSHEDILQAYRENLELALTEVEKMMDTIDGKTVISADHGEILGERLRPVPISWYGHPRGHYMKELVKVPWFITVNGSRRVIEDNVQQFKEDEFDVDEIRGHLKELGYRE